MNPLLKAIAIPVFYLGLFILGLMCLAWCLCAFLLRPFLTREKGRQVGRAGISKGFRLYFAISGALGLTRFELDELDALNQEHSLVLAANHPTFLDAVFLISRLDNVACIMKPTVLDNIFLGAGARLAGYIRNDNPRGMVRLAIEDLKQGSQLLVFPEGTRTVQHPVNDFKPGFGLIAKGAKVPVQTIFIESNSPFLTKGWPILRVPPSLPLVYRARLGQRFMVENSQAFSEELQRYFEQELAQAQLSLLACPDPVLVAGAESDSDPVPRA
jgi:1-acyl-sn-glycerol-3-phosphate acyltransferase